MGEKENEEVEYSLDEERRKLRKLGVENTWNLLKTGEKKKKEQEKKTFRGFD